MSDDPHSPTHAGPQPEAVTGDGTQAHESGAQPTPVVPLSEASFGTPPGSAQPGAPSGERPELLVGAAFVGGLVAAQVLKRLLGGRD